LECFDILIDFCKKAAATDSIKKARKGLTSIALDYINGLSQLYL